MSICVFDVQLKGRKIQGTICGLLFMILSIAVYTAEISGSAISFAIKELYKEVRWFLLEKVLTLELMR